MMKMYIHVVILFEIKIRKKEKKVFKNYPQMDLLDTLSVASIHVLKKCHRYFCARKINAIELSHGQR